MDYAKSNFTLALLISISIFTAGATALPPILKVDSLQRIKGKLSQKTVETSAGWFKYENNPVLGGDLGTCFDVALLRENDS